MLTERLARSRIIREEGFFSMWNGNLPTVTRAMAINLGMLASYDLVCSSLFLSLLDRFL
jgi:solute carrier family 25 oxoglutarate transporter 11